MKLLLCFTLLVVVAFDKGCQQQVAVDQKNSQVTYSTTLTDTGKAVTSPEQPDRQAFASAPCQPLVVHAYDDASGSVDDANSRMAKEQVISGLRKHPDACVKVINLTQFGVGSVWATPARPFVLPLRPHCPLEPDYDQLPSGVRNLETWREDLRHKHQLQCRARAEQFQRDYSAAVTTFAAALLSSAPAARGQKNTCTSFGNLIARARHDLHDGDGGRIMLFSDLIWDCREKKPKPFNAKGVIVQIANGGTDDKIRTPPEDLAAVFQHILPEVSVVQAVNAERAFELLIPARGARTERATNSSGN